MDVLSWAENKSEAACAVSQTASGAGPFPCAVWERQEWMDRRRRGGAQKKETELQSCNCFFSPVALSPHSPSDTSLALPSYLCHRLSLSLTQYIHATSFPTLSCKSNGRKAYMHMWAALFLGLITTKPVDLFPQRERQADCSRERSAAAGTRLIAAACCFTRPSVLRPGFTARLIPAV